MNSRQRDDQPKDYSATLIMLTVCGFALLKWWIG